MNVQIYEQTLRYHSISNTPQRRFIFEILDQSKSPVTMLALVKKASPDINRSTVYRTVDVFENIGIIKRVYTGWKYKVELGEPFSRHHHHLNCTRCNKVETFHEPEQFEKLLQNIANNKHFKIQTHTLELSGICRECQKQ